MKYKSNIIKGGFNRNLFDKIKKITDQNDLACILGEDETLVNFAKQIFWTILTKLRTIFNNDENFSKYVKELMRFKTNVSETTTVLDRIGYTDEQIDKIIKTVTRNRSIHFYNLSFLQIGDKNFSVHTLTSMIHSSFNGSKNQSLFIRHDDELFEKFIKELKLHYNLPDKFTKEDFMKIYEEKTTTGEHTATYKRSLDMLITKLLHMSDNYKSIIQKNYGREIFSRKNKEKDYVKEENDYPKCFENLEKISDAKKIYGVKNTIDLEGTFTKAIFEKYGKEAIGGISGTAYYTYFLIFKILKYEDVVENFSKVLCLCVVDFVPLWHNLEEILLTFSIEFEKSNHSQIHERYYLNQDPLDYFKSFLKKFQEVGIAEKKSKSNNSRYTQGDMIYSNGRVESKTKKVVSKTKKVGSNTKKGGKSKKKTQNNKK